MAMAMLRKPSGRYVLHEGGVPNGAAASPLVIDMFRWDSQ